MKRQEVMSQTKSMQYPVSSILTLIACCMKSIAISIPNNSPARRVNLLMIEQAPRIASKNNNAAVQTHTLRIY